MSELEDFREDFNFDFEDDSKDLPEEKRLGFFSETWSSVTPDFAAAAQKAGELFTAKKWFIDEDDYEWMILAQAVDQERNRLAWVEWRFKQGSGEREYHNYYLKARSAAGEYWRWEIETYNPYFGCDVKLLEWLETSALLIYKDKHDTYAARLNDAGAKRMQISPEWKIADSILIDDGNSQKIDLETFEVKE